MLPVRESIPEILAPVPSVPAPLLSSDELDLEPQAPDTLYMPAMKPMDHVVMLPMASFVRDVYQAAIYKSKTAIQAFLGAQEAEAAVIQEIDSMVEDLKMICDHQDLIGEMSSTQAALSDTVQSKWAENCSTKCLFVKELLDGLRATESHIAILARPGRMLDILEAILKTNNYIYKRPDRHGSSSMSAVGPMRVTLFPTGTNGGEYVIDRADAVIAFDSTFRVAERYSKLLRADLIDIHHVSPLISLVVTHSAEHVEFCLPKGLNNLDRKSLLVNCITQTRREVGILDSDMPGPDIAAIIIAKYLESADPHREWPLPFNADVTGLEIPSDLSLQQQSGSTTQSLDPPMSGVLLSQINTKRSLVCQEFHKQGTTNKMQESEFDDDSSKRMRLTPALGETISNEEFAHDIGAQGYPSHAAPISSDLADASTAISHAAALDDMDMKQTEILLSKVSLHQSVPMLKFLMII